MFPHVSCLSETAPALVTDERLLAGVSADVMCQVGTLTTHLRAVRTLIGSDIFVSVHMSTQLLLHFKTSPTNCTHVRAFVCVPPRVNLHQAPASVEFATEWTRIRVAVFVLVMIISSVRKHL